MENLHSILQDGLEIQSMKLGLDRVVEVDRLLGSPSSQFPSVHVGGTNGKGSVSTKMACALTANGKKIGLYTSPHIYRFHERIQINGTPIPEARADYWLKKIVEISPFQLSYFELLTLLMFCYFAEEKIDCGVLEVGMGGRLDATNIVKPILSVITSIDKDHMLYLGDTLEKIAYEKAGIIKPGVPVLLGPHVKPLFVFEEMAAHLKSPIFQVSREFAHYEEENQAIARKGLQLLPFPLENKSIEMGLAAVPPCRFEIISHDPIVILDVAHNPDGFKRTFQRIHYTFPEKKIRVVAGFSADKEIEECLAVIKKYGVDVHLTYSNHPRLRRVGNPSVEQAFKTAYLTAKQNQEILMVCGTFFIMHEARLAAKSMLESGDG